MFTTEQVTRATGLTQRQLDRLLRQRYIHHDDPTPGTGKPRTFTREQLETAAMIAELTRAGVTVRTAAIIANQGPDYEHGHTQIRVDEPRIIQALNHSLTEQDNQNDNRGDRHVTTG